MNAHSQIHTVRSVGQSVGRTHGGTEGSDPKGNTDDTKTGQKESEEKVPA